MHAPSDRREVDGRSNTSQWRAAASAARMGDRAPETERLTGRCLAMTLSGARLNGDFSLPSQLPIWTWSAPGTRLHDAIEAVKPLSPPDSWGDFVVADIGLGTVVRIAA